MANVVELIATTLKREGVQYIFGIPGGGGTIDLREGRDPLRADHSRDGRRHDGLCCGGADWNPRCRPDGHRARRYQCGQWCGLRLSGAGTEFQSPNYVKIAEAFGGRGTSVGTEAEYADALKEALTSKVLTLIEARVDPSQYAAQFDAIREL